MTSYHPHLLVDLKLPEFSLSEFHARVLAIAAILSAAIGTLAVAAVTPSSFVKVVVQAGAITVYCKRLHIRKSLSAFILNR